jgi:hypothetical protein
MVSPLKSMNTSILRIFFMLAAVAVAVTCNREMLDPDPNALPGFSSDTVTFDTVFTTIGSATLSLKVYNPGNRPLLINSIELAGGGTSYFRLNIDGESAPYAGKVEIPPDDSLFIFIAVTIDPTNVNNPLVIKDSIVFNTNGKLQDVKLIAYGQDVHLIRSEVIETQTWTNDKPYLIYNSMAVDTFQTLTLEAGTQIFFHRNSSMIIWGTLVANGSVELPVVFQNDRLEEFYDVLPGQWGTLYFDPISTGNKLDHVIIKNAIAGIQIGYPSDYRIPTLELTNSYILNTSYAGIYAFGAELLCYNTVIANCAGPATALLRGGDYRFLHCTISNQGVYGASRTSPCVLLTNTFNNPEYQSSTDSYIYVLRAGDLDQATFVNSIIYGTFEHEIELVNNKTNVFNYRFDHCLMKVVEDSVKSDIVHFNALVLNKDPVFKNSLDRYYLNFSLDTLSPAKEAGDPQLLLTYPFLETDIVGAIRSAGGMPDLGAFERKEE